MAKQATVLLRVSKGIKEHNQQQIALTNMPERDDKKQISHKKGVVSLIRFPYKLNGQKLVGEVVVGDTHAIHKKHQSAEQVKHFDHLYGRLSEPQTISRDGVSKVVCFLDKDYPVSVEIVEDPTTEGLNILDI